MIRTPSNPRRTASRDDGPPGRQDRPGWKLIAAGCLTGLLLLVYGALAARAGHDANLNKDFTHLWLGGRMIVEGRAAALYDPAVQEAVYRKADPEGRSPRVWSDRNRVLGGFFYPPATALAYAVLSWLPVHTAAVLNAYVNLALALFCGWQLSCLFRKRVPVMLAVLAILVYPGFFVTLSLGQNSLLTTAVILLAWRAADRHRDFTAGLVLGALVLKPNWLVGVLWIPLIHGRWRMLAGVGVGAGGLLAISLLSVGHGPFASYAELVQRLSALQELPGYNLLLTYNGLSMFRKWLGVGAAADALGWLSSLVVLATTWRATRGRWQPGTDNFHLLVSCSLLAALWVNPHLFYYDLLPTVICLAVPAVRWPHLSVPNRVLIVGLVVMNYAAIVWDEVWSMNHLLPIPTLAVLFAWLWCARQLAAATAHPSAGNMSATQVERAVCLGTMHPETSQ